MSGSRMKVNNCSRFVSPPGRPCVDCHAFEFMQRALQDLKKTAFNLDSRVRTGDTEQVQLLSFFSFVGRRAG